MQPRFGTSYVDSGGKLTRIVDRTGAVHAELTWRGDQLERLEVTGAVLHGELIDDPLLGRAHPVGATTISAIDWARPTQIPTVADPARLPPGAGGMILDVIAVLAARADIPALRYAGPYPTPALWHALTRSFRTGATEPAFTAGVLDRALRVARDELPFDFAPAPFERIANPHGWVELRDGLERAMIDGVTYGGPDTGTVSKLTTRSPVGTVSKLTTSPSMQVAQAGPRTLGTVSKLTTSPDTLVTQAVSGSPTSADLVVNLDTVPTGRFVVNLDTVPSAEVWIGDWLYARVASFDREGALIDGPHRLPRCESAVVGRAFPPDLRAALAELVAEAVPAPIAELAREVVTTRTIGWADLGARVARRTDAGFAVHAALWERIAPQGLARLALALAEALAPEVAKLVVSELARASVRG